MSNREVLMDVINITKSYHCYNFKGKETIYPILKDISFKVMTNDFIGIMGRSGCGKTTLLNTIGMVYQPDSGNIYYKNKTTDKIGGNSLAKIRRQEISYVFQTPYLMDSISVKDNIMLPRIINEEDCLVSEKKMIIMAKRLGIDNLLNKKPYELSGGEKQRVAICRSIIGEPELILADEPTGNLDSLSSENVLELFNEINLKNNMTIVMVTHDPYVASFCNRIFFLKDGLILNELKKRGKQEEYYEEIVNYMRYL